MKKIILFMSLNNYFKVIINRGFYLVGVGSYFKENILTIKLLQYLGKHMEETPFFIKEEGEIKILKLISFSVNLMSKHTLLGERMPC